MIKRYIELFKVCNDLRSEFRDKEVIFTIASQVSSNRYTSLITLKIMIQLVTQDRANDTKD